MDGGTRLIMTSAQGPTIWFMDKIWHDECQAYSSIFQMYGDTEQKAAEVNEEYSKYRAAAREYDDASKKYVARDANEDYLMQKQTAFIETRNRFLNWVTFIKG